MIPNTHLTAYRGRASDHAESSELRRYLRDEWQAEPAWLYAGLRSGEISLRQRIVRWARRRFSRTSVTTSVRRETAPSGAEEPAETPIEIPCDHDSVEDLGVGGSATYAQCTACGALLVFQGGRTWIIRRTRSVDARPWVLHEAQEATPSKGNEDETAVLVTSHR